MSAVKGFLWKLLGKFEYFKGLLRKNNSPPKVEETETVEVVRPLLKFAPVQQDESLDVPINEISSESHTKQSSIIEKKSGNQIKNAFVDRMYPIFGWQNFEILVTAAEAGESWAQFDLACMYDYGLYVAEDANKAFYWYMRAANQGVPAAQNAVGVMYDSGRGVIRDADQALKWYESAAVYGDKEAKANLAEFYIYERRKLVANNEILRRYRKRLSQRVGMLRYCEGRSFFFDD